MAALVLAAGCNAGRGSASFPIGSEEMPLKFSVSADNAMFPMQLQDTSTTPATVASLPCGPSMPCPDLSPVSVACDMGACNPDPIAVELALQLSPTTDVFDLDRYESSLGFASIDSVTIESIEYQVTLNTLNVDVPAVTLYWSGPGSSNRHPFGTIDPIAQGEQPSGTLTASSDSTGGMLDPAGLASLSDYLLHTEPSARFFVGYELDIDPGDPWPVGSVDVEAIITVRVEGSLI